MLLEQHPSNQTHNLQPHATPTATDHLVYLQPTMNSIPQPGRMNYSHTPHLQPTITKVMCRML